MTGRGPAVRDRGRTVPPLSQSFWHHIGQSGWDIVSANPQDRGPDPKLQSILRHEARTLPSSEYGKAGVVDVAENLQTPGHPLEQLLEIGSFRRAGGEEVSLSEFPLAEWFGTGESVRAEEIVVSTP